MNNMQKNFDKKSSLRRIHMADGGIVDKAKTDLSSRRDVIDNAVSRGTMTPPAPQPAPKPTAPPAPQPSEDAQRAAVGMAPKKGLLRSLLGLAEGGEVQGPGGPREDKVPAMLSNGEYVLPAKTVEKLGGPEGLDELVEQTNDGREPGARSGPSLRAHLYNGGAIEVDSNGRPMTNGQSVLRGNQLATIPGEVAQTPRIPGTSLVPTQPAPTPPPTATPQPQAQPQPSAAAPKPGMLSRVAGAGLRMVGGALPIAIAQQGFNDYEPTDRSVPYDATSQLRMLAGARQQFGEGNFSGAYDTAGNLGKSLGNSLISTAADVGSGTAKVIDGVGGFFGQDVGAKKAFDQSIKDDPNFSSLIRPKIPGGGALQPGSSQAGAGRGFVNPQTLGIGPGPEGLLNTNGGTPTDAAPSPRSLAQSRYLSEQGVDVATQASAPVAGDLRSLKTQPGQFLNLGSFQGQDNIYGTSTTKGGRVNSFVGAGDPNRQESQQTQDAVAKLQSDLAADKLATAQKAEQERLDRAAAGNSGAINARFDAMANKVQGSYSAKGKGNEAKRMLEIEAQRNNALEADARNTTSVRGQTLQAQNNSAENVLKGKQIDAQAQANAATLRAQSAPKPINPLEAAKFAADRTDKAREKEETGAKDVQKTVADSIARRFPNTKDDPAQAKQAEDLAAFMRTAPPAVVDRIRSQDPTEREAGIQLGMNLFDQTQRYNAQQEGTLNGITTSGPVMPKGDARRARLGDFAGPGSLPYKDILRLPAGAVGLDYGQVQPTDTGAVAPLSLFTDDDSGTKNASKVSSLQQQRILQRTNEEKARIEKLKQEAKK